MKEKIPLSTPASIPWPYGVEAPVDELGRIIPNSQYSKLKIPQHVVEALEKRARDVENLARIAYRRFPALGRGESFKSSEISARLAELRKAGYEIPPYSHLSKEDKLQLLYRIRREIRDNARKYCPYVLREIAITNELLRKQERELR